MSVKKYHGRILKVIQLPIKIRREINKMLLSDDGDWKTYQEISDWLKRKGYNISKSSVWRYVKYYQTNNKYRQIQDQIELNLLKLYEGLTKKASESLDLKDVETVLSLEKILAKKKEVIL